MKTKGSGLRVWNILGSLNPKLQEQARKALPKDLIKCVEAGRASETECFGCFRQSFRTEIVDGRGYSKLDEFLLSFSLMPEPIMSTQHPAP